MPHLEYTTKVLKVNMNKQWWHCREWQIIGLPVFLYLPMYFLVKLFFPPNFCFLFFRVIGFMRCFWFNSYWILSIFTAKLTILWYEKYSTSLERTGSWLPFQKCLVLGKNVYLVNLVPKKVNLVLASKIIWQQCRKICY